eukprot:3870712-Prymnesium_polylepis.2
MSRLALVLAAAISAPTRALLVGRASRIVSPRCQIECKGNAAKVAAAALLATAPFSAGAEVPEPTDLLGPEGLPKFFAKQFGGTPSLSPEELEQAREKAVARKEVQAREAQATAEAKAAAAAEKKAAKEAAKAAAKAEQGDDAGGFSIGGFALPSVSAPSFSMPSLGSGDEKKEMTPEEKAEAAVKKAAAQEKARAAAQERAAKD